MEIGNMCKLAGVEVPICTNCRGDGYRQLSVDPENGELCKECNGTGESNIDIPLEKLVDSEKFVDMYVKTKEENDPVMVDFSIEHKNYMLDIFEQEAEQLATAIKNGDIWRVK